ncbi:hypothetical protein [Sphaerisporangium sp. NPDC051011]|uniref:hypothetical protein n=1 Tax=Sphaerisporangium sp. NPDC051011 TaxID=3155792 RepID=UPI0033CBBC1A
MTPTVVRDLVTEQTYSIPPVQAVHAVGTLVDYTLNGLAVGRIRKTLRGTVDGDSAIPQGAAVRIPLRSDLRGVYPDNTQVAFSGTIERVSSLDALTWNLGTMARRVDVTDAAGTVPQPPNGLGVSIEQDAQDKSDFPKNQAYYHLKGGTAWTTRVQTCAALAMWSRTARISYLSHADAGTSPVTVSEHVAEYLAQAVKGGADLSVPGELTAVILLAHATLGEDNGSLQVLSLSLNHLPTAQAAIVYRNARCHIIGPRDYVAVQAGGPPRVLLLPDVRAGYLLTRYTATPTPAMRDLLVQAVPTPAPGTWLVDRNAVFEAAQAAKAQDHETLLPVFARLLGYEDAAEARRKLWSL